MKRTLNRWSRDGLHMREPSEDEASSVANEYEAGSREVERATAVGALVISEDSMRVLAEMRRKIAKIDHRNQPSFETYADESAAVGECIPTLTKSAQDDLEVSRRGIEVVLRGVPGKLQQ